MGMFFEGEDPVSRLAEHGREFGEFGGVNASIEMSTTFTGVSLTPKQP